MPLAARGAIAASARTRRGGAKSASEPAGRRLWRMPAGELSRLPQKRGPHAIMIAWGEEEPSLRLSPALARGEVKRLVRRRRQRIDKIRPTPYNSGMGFPARGRIGSTRSGDLRSFKTGRLKRRCLTSRVSGMEGCIKLTREISRKDGTYHFGGVGDTWRVRRRGQHCVLCAVFARQEKEVSRLLEQTAHSVGLGLRPRLTLMS